LWEVPIIIDPEGRLQKDNRKERLDLCFLSRRGHGLEDIFCSDDKRRKTKEIQLFAGKEFRIFKFAGWRILLSAFSARYRHYFSISKANRLLPILRLRFPYYALNYCFLFAAIITCVRWQKKKKIGNMGVTADITGQRYGCFFW